MEQQTSSHTAKHQGRLAFTKHGVGGYKKNPYDSRVEPDAHMAFRHGFTEAQFAAQEAAQKEAVAYHRLSVREAPKDRAWAEKLIASRGAASVA